jgi:phosphoserine phosphatase
VSLLKAMDYHIVVLSEGYDISIEFHKVKHQVKDIYCSKLLTMDGRLTGGLEVFNKKKWRYNDRCIGCCICKVDFLFQLNKKSGVEKSIAVGDGRSDECLFQYIDVSFSLNEKIKASFQAEDLGEVYKILKKQQRIERIK